MWRLFLVGAGVIGAVVVGVVLAQSPPTQSKGESTSTDVRPKARDDRFTVQVTPEMTRHSRIRYALYFIGTAYGFGVLLLILNSGWSRKLRDLAARLTSNRFFMAMIYIALFTLVSALLTFPLDYYSSFMVPHQFDLSNQSFAAWMWDHIKGLLVGLVIGTIVGALALSGIRAMPRRWWLALWLGGIPISIFLVVIAPVLIDTVFNKFEPLKNPVLRQKLLDLASLAGISGADVFQVDRSKQTKTMNAYVTGIGPTKRIVLWDTLLAKMSDDEILAVMGHEMGHYVLNHIWKGMAIGAVGMLGVLFAGQRIVEKGTSKWGPKWGFATPDDPAALPYLLLVLGAITFLSTPVVAGYSRRIEHQSDMFTLELTHLNEAAATAFVKFAEDSKIDPRPPKLIELWLYSHPTLADRIEFALSYRPWEEGKPNQLWKRSVAKSRA